MRGWHHLSAGAVLAQLHSDADHGLSETEATRRLAQHAPNELIERGLKSPWRILWEQLTATMVVILIIAAIVSALLGDFKDAVAILAIVVLNTALGFAQEYRAERAMAALKKMAAPTATVIRLIQRRPSRARPSVVRTARPMAMAAATESRAASKHEDRDQSPYMDGKSRFGTIRSSAGKGPKYMTVREPMVSPSQSIAS